MADARCDRVLPGSGHMKMQSSPWTAALNEAVLLYGLKTPYHAGKWRAVDALTRMLRLQAYYGGKTFTVQRQGIWWALNPDCLIQRSLYYLSVFEVQETQWLKPRVRPDWVFFDVGANFGYYSMIVSAVSQARARVYAFEPLTSNFHLLARNKSLNAFDRIHALKVALSDQTGEVDFLVPPLSCSGVGRIVDGPVDDSNGYVDKVQTTTLDAFVAQRDVQRLDFLKIDVEGAELRVLRGASASLRRFRPTIMIEFFPQGLASMHTSAGELLDTLHALGYATFRINRGHLQPFRDVPRDGYCNVICLPKAMTRVASATAAASIKTRRLETA
jgi:FkbM family methyltransferase